MKKKAPDKLTRRVAVVLGPGGSGRNLLDVVLPLLGRDKAIEMQGIFLEEAELKHAADLPFVKELCRVTFSVREFNSEEFDRVLALRMRTAQRALSVLAKRAGVSHSFRNVRGSAGALLLETANQSDIIVFEPVRSMVAATQSKACRSKSLARIVVVIHDFESGSGALTVASHLASGETERLSVLLPPTAASDPPVLNRLFGMALSTGSASVRSRTLPGTDVDSLIAAVQSEGASLVVIAATPEFMAPEALSVLRQRLRCPICLVRQWPV